MMRPAARPRIVLITFVALVAIACLIASRLPFSGVKPWVDARSADGEVESFDGTFHTRLQDRSLLAAVVLVAGVVVLIILRRWVDHAIGRTLEDARTWRTDVPVGTIGLWRSMDRWEAIAVGAALLLGTVLRGIALSAPVIYDEAFTCTYYAVRPLPVIISDYSYPNNHILHTLLVKLNLFLFGWGEVQARLPAFGAGTLALLFGWTWARGVFGRRVALVALVLFSLSAPLVEYSALARGYSMTWLCLMAALVLALQFTRTGNGFAAILLAGVNALGMWAVPTMIYGSAMVYLWAWSSIPRDVGRSVRSRRLMLLCSGGAFILITLLLYAPVLITYGTGQLFHHDARNSSSLSVEEMRSWWPLAFVILVAAIASHPFRRAIMALVIAIVPWVLLQGVIGPARIWYFLLFLLLPALPIVVEAGLDRLRGFMRASDGLRSLILGSVTLPAFFLLIPHGPPDRIRRYPEAAEAAALLSLELGPTDRVLVNFPCEAPLEFHFRAHGLGIEPLYRNPQAGGRLWFVLGTDDEHTFEAVAARAGLPAGSWTDPQPVRELDRMAIFAAQMR